MMRVPLSWLAELVPATAGVPAKEIAARLTRAGFEVESIDVVGADVTGVVVGRVLSFDAEPQKNGKVIRWCQVDVGEAEPRGIVCGAGNFKADDLVAAALPGAVLPGDFRIAARKTYGHVSDGMLCSARELGLGDDHDGIITFHGDHELGSDAVKALGIRSDVVLDLAITQDRGYALSMRGVAREAAIAFEAPFSDPAELPLPGLSGGHPVELADPSGCDRYVARAVTGLDPAAPTPAYIAERLELCGMRPISLAVDVTNYVMLALGQPLHAFDRAKLQGPIVVRRAAAGERLTTLDGVDRALTEEDLLITDDSGPIALAGVMGGGPTEVSGTTTEVLLEAAHFDARTTTRAGRRHGLSSEAGKRFEREVDPELPPYAAEYAVRLLVEHGGATAEPAGTDTREGRPTTVLTMRPDAAARKAGRDYEPDAVVLRLTQVGCRVAQQDEGLSVVPPSWRPDLRGEAELTEEVIRLEGYETLPSVVPRSPGGRGLTQEQRSRRAVGIALASAGYVELVVSMFLGRQDLEKLGLPEGDDRFNATEVANPLSDDAALLRTTLLPGLLAAAARNIGRGSRDVAAFEMGHVFRPGPGGRPAAPPLGVDGPPTPAQLAALEAALPAQPLRVGVVLTGQRRLASWDAPAAPVGWADAVAAAQAVAGALRVTLDVAADEHAPWHPGRCAALSLHGELVGHAGELHPRVARAHDLPDGTAVAELDLTRLMQLAGHTTARAPQVSPYPPVGRDVALVVDAGVAAATVAGALREGAGELLESLRLFDDYTGPQVGEGKRSLAYRLVLRAADRTLTDEAANAARDAAVALVVERTGAELRT